MSEKSGDIIVHKPRYDDYGVECVIISPLFCIVSEPRWPRHETDPLDTQTISSERVLTSGFSYGTLFDMRRELIPRPQVRTGVA